MKHELKTWTQYFEEVWDRVKTFEVRKNDRNFQVGDTLILKEWNQFRQTFTGRKMSVKVTYILDDPEFVKEGYVIMGIK